MDEACVLTLKYYDKISDNEMILSPIACTYSHQRQMQWKWEPYSTQQEILNVSVLIGDSGGIDVSWTYIVV